MENFWAGGYAPTEGALKQKFLFSGKLPHSQAQRGAAKCWKTRHNRDLEGSKQRELHFSAH